MCGIIGGIKTGGITSTLLTGLSRLEYRGYDSAGLAVYDGNRLQRSVVVGRVARLRRIAAHKAGTIGIGHTRWATHGPPTENNAHPIRAGRVVVVHNGIIENHAELRRFLEAQGRCFSGQTDTEVLAHLLDIELAKQGHLLSALRQVRQRLEGAYALAAMADGVAEIVCLRQGSPLLAAMGDDGVFIASDAQSLAGVAQWLHYFEEGEYACLTAGSITIYNCSDDPIPCQWNALTAQIADTQLGEYRHFMQKEIFAQPDAVAATMERYVATEILPLRRFGSGATRVFRRCRQVTIVACGTSYHAALIARYWLMEMGISCQVDVASEYRYRRDPTVASSLVIGVSQSGETADTLLALRAAKAAGAVTLAVVNVESSSMLREADLSFCTRAGVEIGVASTKSFVAQLTALLLITMGIAKARHRLPAETEASILRSLRRLPYLLQKALLLEESVRQWAHDIAPAKSALYIGRHTHYPMALEGALKLKEISYIHAEGIAAGELKHGPLALVEAKMPIIALAPDDNLSTKMAANLSEVTSRDGQLFVLAGQSIVLPDVRVLSIADDGGTYLSPMVYAIPLQLLAYHTARQKGTDVDKPRNLAKSVTVE